MNRIELQELAEERARDALALLNVGQWSGAYYLAGYAVECGLKACVAKLTNQYDFPDKDYAQRCYTHDVEKLVDIAGLKAQRQTKAAPDPVFAIYWNDVKDWDERARYKRWTEQQARDLVTAVTDPTDGVLQWIRAHW